MLTTASTLQSITPTLTAWSAYEPAVKCDLSSHAVRTPEGLILIDPIALTAPESLSKPPTAILLTNANHARAALGWRERTGARIFAPATAVPELDLTPDATLADGDLTPGGFRTISLPGGAPGETAYVGHGLCCVGDALIHLPALGFTVLPEKYCINAPLLRDSLKKLLSCDFRIMTFAHGNPLVENARDRLASLLA